MGQTSYLARMGDQPEDVVAGPGTPIEGGGVAITIDFDQRMTRSDAIRAVAVLELVLTTAPYPLA